MKSWILVRILRWLGRKLDGKKTLIGGIGSILWGIVGLLGVMFPDAGLPDIGIEASVGFIVGGFGALGIGGKLEKLRGDKSETEE